ncbi:CHAT domain-containing protein [Beggiatoa leptomitoformis]|uniref:CHAT domain-containing protein n=1 Tax=Beggiatoa leptomitoformis TaxID=288004 RepID=A0A2N9YJ47_9GAMM|nr:CHAT domain-containing protein [Beggiatoa leptomitoformis]ALG66831.1 CHAT domain-containing protein [Beggiatoa leptomitoformis]AUI70514.2 CHAT domain-containing protein [Beggiatoa leptomitoformis]
MKYNAYYLVLLLCYSVSAISAEIQGTVQQREQNAQLFLQQGNFEQAVQQWQSLLDSEKYLPAEQINLLSQLASAYQAMGLSKKAMDALQRALTLANNDKARLTALYVGLSDLALATRQELLARDYADRSLFNLPSNAPALLRAAVLNNHANVLTVEAYYSEATDIYSQSLQLAQQTDEPILSIRILINRANAYWKNGQEKESIDSLTQASTQLYKLPDQYAKAFAFISIGELTQRVLQDQKTADGTSLAYNSLNTALTIAEQLKNNRLRSYAKGYLGHLYENEKRFLEAQQLTQQAIFFAQQTNTPEIRYRWQWQLGRIFAKQNLISDAIPAYRHAIAQLQPIRQELAVGYRNTSQSFRDTISPLYFELADLLLQTAKTADDKKIWLDEARDTIEKLKTAELQDYFQDECVTGSQSKPWLLDVGIPHTAVIYPILLNNRIEMLLSLPNGIQQFTLPFSHTALKDEVNEFRFELETRNTRDYLPYAQQLYHWLIQPLEAELQAQAIDTLVIIPDGVLRTIPLAALHDGKQFLVERYAVVTSPGLTLTDSKPINKKQLNILLSGLSEGVQGYPALANIRQEIDILKNLYGSQSSVLLNRDFTVTNFSSALNNIPYNVVHIASHGQFDSDPQKTFLLTYDGRLDMNRLEKLIRLSDIRNEPMELLTLSACQTAVGDDQAALGLASIALKAGARSALATLWSIDDQATTQLIAEFYRQLQKDNISKAKALQNAQLFMLKQANYQHPAFWAAFLLIGNWL